MELRRLAGDLGPPDRIFKLLGRRPRQAVVVASLLASGVACVNLDRPEQVATCSAQGNCINVNADAPSASELDASSPSNLDAGLVSEAGSSVNKDGPSTQGDARIPDASISTADGPQADLPQSDLPITDKDGPESPRDVAAPDVPAGVCTAGGAPKPAGTVCRPAVGLCDIAEVCDGVSPDCPPDKLAAAATPCRPAAGDCDIAETCDGISAVCPVDGFKAAGTVCRASAGVCDVVESCDGLIAACPIDSMAPATTVCRASSDGNACDPAEDCNGTDVACPSDVTYAAPAAPTGLTGTPGTLEADLSWSASTGATGYNVKQSTSSDAGFTTLIGSPTTTATTYVDKELTGGVTYYYQVTAINTIPTCESGPSATISVKPGGTCAPPTAPVVTAAASNGSVTLTWAAVSGAVSYTVARSQTAGTGYSTVGTVTTGTTFTDGNVVNGVTYYYVVTASNGSCSSVKSNEVSSSPACTPPAAPTGLGATPSNGSVTLKWNASAGAVSYSIYRNTTGTAPFTFVNSTTQLTFTDSNVVNDTKYYYIVQASNGSCASANSAVASVTPACVPPAAPSDVAVAVGDGQLSLSWTAPTGATQYRVSRNTTGTGTFTQIGLPTTTNYVDKPLTDGTAYYYVVDASNGSCWSGHSAVASGTPVCIPPPVPGTLTPTAGDGQVSLSWVASPGATTYTIWRKAGATGTYASIGTSTSTTYVDKSLTDGTTYYYKITAGNGSCDSNFNTEEPVTPVAVCSQTAATNLQAVPSGSVQVTLTWTAATPQPTTYSVARTTTSGTNYQSIDSVPGTATTYTDTDTKLVKGTKYYYQIIANGTCTATSAEVSATTACTNPTTPGTPTVTNSAGALTVTWTTVNGATAYTVYRSTSLGGTYTAIATSQTAATFTDPASGLTNGTTYYYEVLASNAGAQCSSGQSSAGSAMSCSPPTIPTGLKATVGTSGQVKLTWTASTNNPAQYTVMRGTSSGAESIITPPGTPPTSATYTDTGLTDWTTYYYKLSAQNGTNNACSSAASAEISATPNSCPVLNASAQNYSVTNTPGPYCFITCWDLAGTGVSNFNGRTLTINGTPVTCTLDGTGGGSCTIPSGLTKDTATYPTSGSYLFVASAGGTGSTTYPGNYWWGTGHTCQ